MDTPTSLVPADVPEHRVLVALAPEDVPQQQHELIDWCTRKVHALQAEADEFEESARVAMDHNWQYKRMLAAATRAHKAALYYTKIKAAVEAGYLIVPNFDIEVMAVRVKRQHVRGRPRHESSSYGAPGEPRMPEVRPDLLPVGEGRYVDEASKNRLIRWTTPKPGSADPKEHVHHLSITPSEFDEVDFPIVAIKPAIMNATARAMSLKIFDRIGVVTGRREDPLVVGQLIDPRKGQGGLWGRPGKVVSFFIAWWLDTRSL